jgi:hypothetical protein
MYNLSTLDIQILEVLSQKDFSTIWDVHAQLNSYDIILVMRAMHALHKEGYLRQEFRGTLTLYYLKRKASVFGELKVKRNFRPG